MGNINWYLDRHRRQLSPLLIAIVSISTASQITNKSKYMNISSELMKIEREKSMMEESIHNNGHITLDCVLVTQYKTTTHSHSMHSKLKQINSTADRLHSTMCQTGSYSMLSWSHTQFRRKMKFPFGFIGIRVSICGFVCLFSAARQDWKYFLLLFLFFLFGSSSLPHRFTWHEWKKMHYNHKRFMAVKTCRITRSFD